MERMNRRIERNKNRNHNGNQNEKRHRKRSRGNMKAENARISAVRLYLHYISIHIRSAMQYKTSFFLTTLGQFLFSFNVFMGITFMFQRFHEVKGFTYSEVLICYALVLVEFSLAEMFARGFDSFSGMVRHAEFDRVLVRPRNEILQVLGSKFELSRIGRSFPCDERQEYILYQSYVCYGINQKLEMEIHNGTRDIQIDCPQGYILF